MTPNPDISKSVGRPVAAPQVISVTSGKGGVGKTSIVANMAILLSSSGKRVLVFDADLGLANIDIILGITPKFNIHQLLEGTCNIEDILLDGPGGIKIIPASSGIQELSSLTYAQQMSIVNALDSLDRDFDYMIVDTGAGISGNVMYFNSAAQRVIVVVTPEPTSITDAYALMKIMRKKYGTKRFDLIINNAVSAYEAKEVFRKLFFACDRFFGDIALDMLGWIPHDSTIPECIREQRAFVEVDPGSEATRKLAAIVKRLERSGAAYESGSLQFFFKRHIEGRAKGIKDAGHSVS
jgi:flagellar biosynthesis protein FlhG